MYKTDKAAILQVTAHRVLRNKVTETLSAFDLSTTEWIILGKLDKDKSLRFNQLSAYLQVEPPLISNLIDHLVLKELVKRTDNLKDRRAKSLTLTKKAKELIPNIEQVLKKAMMELLNGTTKEDLVAYFKVLEIIIRNGR